MLTHETHRIEPPAQSGGFFLHRFFVRPLLPLLRHRWGTLDDVAMEAKAREVMGRLNPNFRRVDVQVRDETQRPILRLSTVVGRY